MLFSYGIDRFFANTDKNSSREIDVYFFWESSISGNNLKDIREKLDKRKISPDCQIKYISDSGAILDVEKELGILSVRDLLDLFSALDDDKNVVVSIRDYLS